MNRFYSENELVSFCIPVLSFFFFSCVKYALVFLLVQTPLYVYKQILFWTQWIVLGLFQLHRNGYIDSQLSQFNCVCRR